MCFLILNILTDAGGHPASPAVDTAVSSTDSNVVKKAWKCTCTTSPSWRKQGQLCLYLTRLLVPFKNRGADETLARLGRKQATATKVLQTTQKQFRRLSVQPGLRGSNDPRFGRKMADQSIVFFNRVGLRSYQHPCINL